jgi:large subunit ribosomal protein L24
MKIKKGDTVEVVSGDDKGARGTVRQIVSGHQHIRRASLQGVRHVGADHNRDRVLVTGINMIKKHQRPTGDVKTQTGIIEREAPVHISNVMLVCPHCQKATRVGHQILETGGKVRICKRCHQTID